MARRRIYRRATKCDSCEHQAATFFASAGPGLAWYLCGNPLCREMFLLPAPAPIGEEEPTLRAA